jgi:DNA-binding transcriptional regulator GbsR (MarR family)
MNAWGSNTDRILLLLAQEPMTKAEICRKLDLSHDQVSSRLTHLRKKSIKFGKRIYIFGYTRHAKLGRTYLRAIYALGNKPDKQREIQPYTSKERSAMSYVRLMARRNSSVFRQTLTKRELYGL